MYDNNFGIVEELESIYLEIFLSSLPENKSALNFSSKERRSFSFLRGAENDHSSVFEFFSCRDFLLRYRLCTYFMDIITGPLPQSTG